MLYGKLGQKWGVDTTGICKTMVLVSNTGTEWLSSTDVPMTMLS